MVTQGTLAKAAFWNEDKNTKVVDCMFNPDKYTVAKTVNVMSTSKLDQDTPDVRFGGSQDTKITINELWFDTWGSDPVVDVRTHTDKVFDLLTPGIRFDEELKRGNLAVAIFIASATTRIYSGLLCPSARKSKCSRIFSISINITPPPGGLLVAMR